MSDPVRIQLSRVKGFNLQALSLATNGLPAVKVDRSTKWGNPFKVGRPCAFTGGIVGSVEIVDCVTHHESDWFVGKFGFLLRRPEKLPFTPWRGQLGFFEVDLDAAPAPAGDAQGSLL